MAHSNTLKILSPKMAIFQIKKIWYFHIFATIYVFEQNKKNNVYPCKPQFYYIKVGFKGVKII